MCYRELITLKRLKIDIVISKLFTSTGRYIFSYGIQPSSQYSAHQHFRTSRTISRQHLSFSSVSRTRFSFCKLALHALPRCSQAISMNSPNSLLLRNSVKLSYWHQPTATSSILSVKVRLSLKSTNTAHSEATRDSPNHRRISQCLAQDLQWNSTQSWQTSWEFHQWFSIVTCRKVTTFSTPCNCATESTYTWKQFQKSTKSCKLKCRFHGNFSSDAMWRVKFIKVQIIKSRDLDPLFSH